jgi:hypothetical protein
MLLARRYGVAIGLCGTAKFILVVGRIDADRATRDHKPPRPESSSFCPPAQAKEAVPTAARTTATESAVFVLVLEASRKL